MISMGLPQQLGTTSPYFQRSFCICLRQPLRHKARESQQPWIGFGFETLIHIDFVLSFFDLLVPSDRIDHSVYFVKRLLHFPRVQIALRVPWFWSFIIINCFSTVKSSWIITSFMYSQICHLSSCCRALLYPVWVILALAFALMSGTGVIETV